MKPKKINRTLNLEFDNKVVLITGASRGIGRAIALEFAKNGATIAVNYHNNIEAAKRTMELLVGDSHQCYQCDISDSNAVSNMVEKIIADFGRIDILVNNAGIYVHHPLEKVDYSEWCTHWKNTIDSNLIGAANVTYCVAREMIKQNGGKIINISSRGAFRGEPMTPAYAASKAGLNAFSQSMAQALAQFNIFVYVVAPGFVETDMAAEILSGPEGENIREQSPLKRVARPEEIANTVTFLASENTEYLTGCIVDVNGASYLRS